MAEKLSHAAWVAFAKKRELDDAAFVKAMAAFNKTDEARPDAQLDRWPTSIRRLPPDRHTGAAKEGTGRQA